MIMNTITQPFELPAPTPTSFYALSHGWLEHLIGDAQFKRIIARWWEPTCWSAIRNDPELLRGRCLHEYPFASPASSKQRSTPKSVCVQTGSMDATGLDGRYRNHVFLYRQLARKI